MNAPEPFKLNIIKHHLLAAKEITRELASRKSHISTNAFFAQINEMGSNLLDLYTGCFTIQSIVEEIKTRLKEQHIYLKTSFIHTLYNKKYLQCNISDGSRWIVRLGNDEDRYIHIHPSRTGEYRIRLHTNAWKTALGMYFLELKDNQRVATIHAVNHLRMNFLALSPIKSLHDRSRISKAYQLLHQE